VGEGGRSPTATHDRAASTDDSYDGEALTQLTA
jgi:hypothetical protein